MEDKYPKGVYKTTTDRFLAWEGIKKGGLIDVTKRNLSPHDIYLTIGFAWCRGFSNTVFEITLSDKDKAKFIMPLEFLT